jgi:hypothetical protein
MDPTLEDTFVAHYMTMYFDPRGNTELQSSLPMAYGETNSGNSQFEDGKEDNTPSADGHY